MIKEKLERYARILDSIRGDQDKYVWLMDFGKNSVPMEAKHKMEEFEVSNCQTATWLVPHYVEDKIYFSADSMALISKGMVCLIADVYSGSSAQDIIDFDQDEKISYGAGISYESFKGHSGINTTSTSISDNIGKFEKRINVKLLK